MSQESQSGNENVSVEMKADSSGLTVKVENITPPKTSEGSWNVGWGLLAAGIAGFVTAPFAGPLIGVIVSGVVVAGVGAKVVNDKLSLPDEQPQDEKVQLSIAPAEEHTDSRPSSVA